MARARNIKPSFFKNELLVEMEPFDRLLFIGLWCLADREGRIEDRPKRIKMELLPCDAYDVDAGLFELQRHGFIKRYEVAGVRVILIVNFHKHQTPHGTEKDSELPDENGEMTVHERTQNGYVNGTKRKNNVKTFDDNGDPPLEHRDTPMESPCDNTLNPDSLNPDSLNPDSLKKPRKRSAAPQVDRPNEVSEQTWADWLALRKAKRAPVTETVVQGARDEASKAGMQLDALLPVWCMRGSQGLQADWIKPAERQVFSRQPMSFAQQDEMARRRRWEEMTGRKWPTDDAPGDFIDVETSIPRIV